MQWADAYDETKLASYCYVALFQQCFDQDNYIVHGIGFVILKAIADCSEIRLSALHLLDMSAKSVYVVASLSSTFLTRHGTSHIFLWTTNNVWGIDAFWLFNDWVLPHLDTLFSPCHIIHAHELAQLEWADTPELVHIAKARLTFYDSLQGEGSKGLKQLKPDPHLLKCFSGPKIMIFVQVHLSGASIWLLLATQVLLEILTLLGCSFQRQWGVSGLNIL